MSLFQDGRAGVSIDPLDNQPYIHLRNNNNNLIVIIIIIIIIIINIYNYMYILFASEVSYIPIVYSC